MSEIHFLGQSRSDNEGGGGGEGRNGDRTKGKAKMVCDRDQIKLKKIYKS